MFRRFVPSFILCMYCGNTGTVGGANCPVCRPGRDWRLT
jgi:hypothetical protein